MPKSSPKRRSRPTPVPHDVDHIYIKPDPDAPESTHHSSRRRVAVAQPSEAENDDDDDPLAIKPNAMTHRPDRETGIPIVRRNRPSGSGKRLSDQASLTHGQAPTPLAGPSVPRTPPPRSSRPSHPSTTALRPAARPKTPPTQERSHVQSSEQVPAAQSSSSRQRVIDVGPALKPYTCPITGNILDESDGDVILTSGDGYTFRCYSFHLKSASPILRDHLAAQTPSTRKFLSLPEEASLIYAFLHLQTIGSYDRDFFDPMDLETALSELERLDILTAICDKYQATRFDQLLKLPYTKLAVKLPWEVFSRACTRSWTTVAREAIRYFGCVERIRTPDVEGFYPGPSNCKKTHVCPSRSKVGIRDWDVGNLNLEAAESLGLTTYHALAQAIQHQDTFGRNMNWSDVAEVFACPLGV